MRKDVHHTNKWAEKMLRFSICFYCHYSKSSQKMYDVAWKHVTLNKICSDMKSKGR